MSTSAFIDSLQNSGISEQKINNVMNVFQCVIESPFEKNMKICSRLNLAKDELKYCYSVIQKSVEAQKMLEQSFPRHYSFFRDRFFSNNFLKKIFEHENPFPIEIEIHPSEVCNINCQFCPTVGNDYKDQEYYSELKPRLHDRDMVIDRIKAIFTELKEGGTKRIILSGGKEPTMSSLILELINAANEPGMDVKLVTNGSGFMIPRKLHGRRISDEDLFKFYASMRGRIHLSLNAHNRKLFNKVKGLKEDSKTFDQIVSNIRRINYWRDRLKKEGRHVAEIYTAVVVDKDNCKQIPEILEFLVEVGVDIISVNRYQYQMVVKQDEFNDDEMKELLRNLEKIKENWSSSGTQLIVSVEDFRNDYYRHVLGIKAKCWTSYYETAINPLFLGLACDTAAFPGRETFGGVDFKLGCVFDYPNFESYWNHTLDIRKKICSDKCSDCRFYHKLINVYVDKLYNDYQNGFGLDTQPFNSFIIFKI